MSGETLNADRLGVTAEKVFDVMVQQAYVARVSDAIAAEVYNTEGGGTVTHAATALVDGDIPVCNIHKE